MALYDYDPEQAGSYSAYGTKRVKPQRPVQAHSQLPGKDDEQSMLQGIWNMGNSDAAKKFLEYVRGVDSNITNANMSEEAVAQAQTAALHALSQGKKSVGYNDVEDDWVANNFGEESQGIGNFVKNFDGKDNLNTTLGNYQLTEQNGRLNAVDVYDYANESKLSDAWQRYQDGDTGFLPVLGSLASNMLGTKSRPVRLDLGEMPPEYAGRLQSSEQYFDSAKQGGFLPSDMDVMGREVRPVHAYQTGMPGVTNVSGYTPQERPQDTVEQLVTNIPNQPKPKAQPAPTGYAVKRGDTLGKIAKANNTTVANLKKLNGIDNVDLIEVGQQLRFN